MPECSCRGTNPNCFKCGGWGWLGDGIAQQRVNPDHSSLSPGKHTSQKYKERGFKRKKLKISDPLKTRKMFENMATCIYCKAVLRPNNLNRHLEKVHGLDELSVYVFSSKITKERLPEANVKKTLKKKKRGDIRKNEITVVVQSPFETRFGDKYLGYMARDKGKYGSISLYDDYGDESNLD
jgi:hypothetical protein